MVCVFVGVGFYRSPTSGPRKVDCIGDFWSHLLPTEVFEEYLVEFGNQD